MPKATRAAIAAFAGPGIASAPVAVASPDMHLRGRPVADSDMQFPG